MDDTIKTVSLIDSDKYNELSQSKNISLVDSNELTKCKTISFSKKTVTDTPNRLSVKSNTDKVISVSDTETDISLSIINKNNLSSVIDDSVKQFSISQINLIPHLFSNRDLQLLMKYL